MAGAGNRWQCVAARRDNPPLGIALILLGILCVSGQDALIKLLSGGYPLHEIILVRAGVGIAFSGMLVWWDGGLRVLRTDHPWLHALRALLVVVANVSFFAGLAALPLAEATALFFVAPLIITMLSVPLLGERVGARRTAAVIIGFLGVVAMSRPGAAAGGLFDGNAAAFLPIVAATAYALMQMLTRKLGATSKASAMVVYNQSAFILVSLLFWLLAGDGRYAATFESESLHFLLRAWTIPQGWDLAMFFLCALLSTVITYCLTQAYRIADAAVIAPFEYVALPLAVIWGWLLWHELPDVWAGLGMGLIMASGLYAFLRERRLGRPASGRRPVRSRLV